MIASQVKFIIEKLGYEMNQLIPLDTVNVIVLEGNYNLYPDSSLRLNFVNKNANHFKIPMYKTLLLLPH